MMAPNPFRAEVPLMIGEQRVTLRLTWGVMGALVGEFGPAWDQEVNLAMETFDFEKVARAIEIATGVPAAQIIEASPPWLAVREAFNAAYSLSIFGHPTLVKETSVRESEASDARPLAPRSFWAKLGGSRLSAVWRRSRSGPAPATRSLNGAV